MANEPTTSDHCHSGEESRNKKEITPAEIEEEMEVDDGEGHTSLPLEDSQDVDNSITAEDNTVRCPCGVNEVRSIDQLVTGVLMHVWCYDSG